MYNNHSDAFGAAVAANGRSFCAKIAPTVGTQSPITDGIFNVTLTSGSNAGSSLTLGSAVAAVLEVEMELPPQELENREIQLSIGIQTGQGIEYIPMGVYRAERPVRKRNKVTFTAYDRMIYRAENPYVSALDYPASDLDVLQEICDQMGVGLDLGEDLAHVLTDEFTNWLSNEDDELLAIKYSAGLYLADEEGTFLTDEAGHYLALEFSLKEDLSRYAIEAAPTGYSYREAIAAIAARHGKFACFNRDGDLTLRWYREAGQINFDRTAEPEPGELDYVLGEISCAVDDGTVLTAQLGGGSGRIQCTDPSMTQDRLDDLISEIGGFTYRAGTIDLMLGDPRIDPWDMFTVNWDGDSYRIPAMHLVHKFDGGLSTTIEAVAESDVERDYDFEGSTARSVKEIEKSSRQTDRSVEQLRAGLAGEQAERQAAEHALSESVRATQQDLDAYKKEAQQEMERQIEEIAGLELTIEQQLSDLRQLSSDLGALSQALATHQADAAADRLALEAQLQNFVQSGDLPVVPTNVSAFFNDAGYLTQHQDLSAYAQLADLAELVSIADLSAYARLTDIVNLYTAGTLIAKNTDLDALTDPGVYISQWSSTSSTLINCPVTGGFRLEVRQTNTGTGYLSQTIYPSSNAALIFRREQSGGAWTGWYRFIGTAV